MKVKEESKKMLKEDIAVVDLRQSWKNTVFQSRWHILLREIQQFVIYTI